MPASSPRRSHGKIQHLLHCGTIWVHGPSATVPTREDAPRRPFGDYGINKAAIESYLLDRARRDGLPVTLIHPGHISGPGWTPINPAANLDLGVFEKLARGDELTLPNLGLETIQHVHAADVAGVFLAALRNRSVAIGESFHAVAEGAMTLRGYAEGVAGSFGQEARLAFLPLGRVATDRVRGGRGGHVRPHRAQPALLDGEGRATARFPSALLGARGHPGSDRLARRQREDHLEAGWGRSRPASRYSRQ